MGLEILIGGGMAAIWFIAIPLWVWNKRRHLSPQMRAQSDFALGEYTREMNRDSITNFNSAAGQVYAMRVEQGFDRLKEP